MSAKRLLDHLDDGEVSQDDEPSPKRAKRLTGAQPRHHHQNSAVDPTWGQKYVFSNTQDASSIPYGDESDFEDDADAMAYLMSVRTEAHGIPHLLVAPKTPIGPQLPPELKRLHDDAAGPDQRGGEPRGSCFADGVADSRAYYDDGAYVARPSPAANGYLENVAGDDHDRPDAEKQLHESYFASILSRYRRLRVILHSQPPPDARLSPAQPTYAAPFGRSSSTAKTWSHALRATDPHPLQLALMSKDSVLRVLRVLLEGRLLRRGYTLSERTSRWLWGLLARLPDPWELDHVELASVRDLGRRAVLLGRSLAEMAALKTELVERGMTGACDAMDAGTSDDEAPGTDAEAARPSPDGDDSEPHQTPIRGRHGTRGADEAADDAGGDDAIDEGAAETESVAMDLASDSDEGAGGGDDGKALAAAKMAFLSRLDTDATPELPDQDQDEAARLRLRINMRATLDMVLTVAGDFYGQRDLLGFRQPFVGL